MAGPLHWGGSYDSRGHCVRSSWFLVTVPQCWMVPFAWLVSGLTTEVKKVKDSVALSFWKIPHSREEGRPGNWLLIGVLRHVDRAYQSQSHCTGRRRSPPGFIFSDLVTGTHLAAILSCLVWGSGQRAGCWAGLDALTLACLASLCGLSLVLLFCYPFWHLDLEQIGARLGHGLSLTVLYIVNIGKTYCL